MTVSFVERLTLRAWFFAIFPRLVLAGVRRGWADHTCYVFDGSRLALAVARRCGRMVGVAVETLRFRLRDVRDEQGILLAFRLPCDDLLPIRTAILDETLRNAVTNGRGFARLLTYLARALTSAELLEEGTLWRALYVVGVCAWKLRMAGWSSGTPVVCFLERRPWFEAVARYASRQGITALPVPPRIRIRAAVRRRLRPGLRSLLRSLRSRWAYARLRSRALATAPSRIEAARRSAGPAAAPRIGVAGRGPRIAVEYYGQLNLDHPDRHSDLFFWQQSALRSSDVIITFDNVRDPLDAEKAAELARHGLAAIALQPQATAIPDAPVFIPGRSRDPSTVPPFASRAGREEARWLLEQVRDYRVLRAFWSEFFRAQGVKIYVSWFKYTPTHCAIADALESVGGITAIYQRAYESHPSVETTVAADIVFGFAPGVADLERRSGSVIRYHVTTGYPGDHRFALVRDEALRLRDTLRGKGADRILAFCDENSHDDDRWHPGHSVERENYGFLLERLLAEPWLGLILKPKTPFNLRRRLGPVAVLLERAEATGRCFVFEEGVVQGTYPPAAAAIAADVMIHGQLHGGTAGLESALAGTPTLLLDRVGWHVSPLYRLGVGRVVFNDWHALWETTVEHWRRPGGVPALGDWSPMLEELDPFRDGRAAERMGTYLQWLLEGLKAGLSRETVMADAAERYSALWGEDKVTHVNWEGGSSVRTSRVPVSATERIPEQ